MVRKFFKSLLNQKGQSLVLYALLVPLLFTVGGAAVDFGWYYMNVSRLQNMADVAVIASAKALTKSDGEFSGYRYNYLLPQVPENLTPKEKDSTSGDLEAKKYIGKNLEILDNWHSDNTFPDNFSNVELTFEKKTFPTTDADGYPILYYEITLTETPQHFFEIFNSVGDLKITAKAAAKFTYVRDSGGDDDDDDDDAPLEEGPTLFDQMEDIKADKVFGYWEVIQNEYKEEAKALKADMKAEVAAGADREEVLQRYVDKLAAKYMARGVSQSDAQKRAKSDMEGDRSADKARERSVTTSGNWWLKDLTSYRTENMSLNGKGGTSWNEKQADFDDIFINALQDLNFKFTTDWDITEPLPKGMKAPDNFVLKYCKIFNSETDPNNLRFYYRIFALIGVEEDKDKPGKKIFPYKVRADRDLPDPLFARIESEPIKWETYYATDQKQWNSVRQFFINVNCANSKEEDRPIVFFYDGPIKFDENSPIRDSKPVILNLNADFRGVLYAPNSPVVVAGNNHNFEGFIVAKKFVKLKTESEFKTEGFKKVVRKDSSHDVYVMEGNIKTSETADIPSTAIAVNYSDGESGKFYYIERNAEHFEKISQVKTDSSRYSPAKIPTMFVNQMGDIAISSEIIATLDGSDKASGSNTADKIFASLEDFGLASSTYNNFFLVKFGNYKYLNRKGSLDNFFSTDRSKKID